MIAIIFEVWPAEGHQQSYLDIAANLRPVLEKMDGFISVERFVSLTDPTKVLSLSFWRDEKAVEQWRTLGPHRLAQEQGRAAVFKDYRLRVGEIDRDYGMRDRKQAPSDSRKYHNGQIEDEA